MNGVRFGIRPPGRKSPAFFLLGKPLPPLVFSFLTPGCDPEGNGFFPKPPLRAAMETRRLRATIYCTALKNPNLFPTQLFPTAIRFNQYGPIS